MVGFPSTAYLGPKAHINSCLIALGDPGGKKRGWCAVRNNERPTLEHCLSSAQLRREEVTRMDVGTQPLELIEWKLWRTTLRDLNGRRLRPSGKIAFSFPVDQHWVGTTVAA